MDYFPVSVAADMADYSVVHVRRLARQGKVQSRKVRGRTQIHLGSLLSYRDRKLPTVARISRWLTYVDASRYSYRQLAMKAQRDLRMKVSPTTVRRACRQAGVRQ